MGAALSTKKVLIVDDEDFVRRLLVTKLKRYGIQTLEADNGVDAIEMAISERPHLILLDAMMPKMNGYDACQRLKAHHETAAIPIIMLMASSDFYGASGENRLGDIEYFKKPFIPQRLAERVMKILDQTE